MRRPRRRIRLCSDDEPPIISPPGDFVIYDDQTESAPLIYLADGTPMADPVRRIGYGQKDPRED